MLKCTKLKGGSRILQYSGMKMSSNKGAIITVLVESRKPRLDRWKNDPIRRTNPNKIPLRNRVFKARGYDRRAQLLAYAQQLRHANAQQLPLPTFKKSKPKLNKWRWEVAMEKIKGLIMRFDGMKGEHKYQPIVVEDFSHDEGSCKQERMKKGRNGRTRKRFCKKLRCLVKKISMAWKCTIDSFRKGH